MKKYFIVLLGFFIFNPHLANAYQISTDPVTTHKVEKILHDKNLQNKDRATRVDLISASFLGTPYKADTLIGSPTTPETLVINMNGVDCLTFVEYVQALSVSIKNGDFKNSLIRTRYIDGQVRYLNRRHFFSDWYANNPVNARDVTQQLSQNALMVTKHLNKKNEKEEYIKGLGIIERKIYYIPSSAVDANVMDRLQTGDYIGIYSKLDGLDVSHTGIIIKKNGNVYFRNASSLAKNMKVVDTPLGAYIKNKPGIVVLRAVTQ